MKGINRRYLSQGLDEHTLYVIKKSLLSTLVKVSGLVISLVISIYLGRSMGAEGLGVIELANRMVGIVLLFSVFGMNSVLIKRIAIANEQGDSSAIFSYLYSSVRFNTAISILIMVLLYWGAEYISNDVMYMPVLEIPLKIAVVVLTPRTLSRIFASALNGMGRVWQSNLVNESLSSWLVGLGLVCIYFMKVEVDVVSVAVAYAIARTLTFMCIYLYWKKTFRFKGQFKSQIGKMIGPATILLFVQGTSVIASNTDSIMLGLFSDAKEVGVYSVALKLATFMIFFLKVTNSAISPKLASLYAEGKLEELQVLVKRITTALIFLATLFLLFFVLAGSFILNFWGSDEFQSGYSVLLILCFGQFFNISTGCAGLLLIMCGYERNHGYLSFIAVACNVLLNYFFINAFGAVGAALATAITITIENGLKVILVKKYLGVLTLPFSFRNG